MKTEIMRMKDQAAEASNVGYTSKVVRGSSFFLISLFLFRIFERRNGFRSVHCMLRIVNQNYISKTIVLIDKVVRIIQLFADF